MLPQNHHNCYTSVSLASMYQEENDDNIDLKWLEWAIPGAQFGLGIGLMFVPGTQGLGIALLASGGLGIASNAMIAAGVDSKTAIIISSGANITIGIGLLFSPLAPIGASMIGAGVGSIGGGYISEALGADFQIGSIIGGFIGGIVGGKIYDRIVYSKIASQGILIGKMDKFKGAAAVRGLAYYDGMPGYKIIEKISPAAAKQLGWANNHRYISNVMKYSGKIYNLGGSLTGSYGKEIALIGKYLFLLPY